MPAIEGETNTLGAAVDSYSKAVFGSHAVLGFRHAFTDLLGSRSTVHHALTVVIIAARSFGICARACRVTTAAD